MNIKKKRIEKILQKRKGDRKKTKYWKLEEEKENDFDKQQRWKANEIARMVRITDNNK